MAPVTATKPMADKLNPFANMPSKAAEEKKAEAERAKESNIKTKEQKPRKK